MSFHLSPEIDNGKMFLVKRSELEGRLDAFFYIPDIVLIDNLVKSKSNLKLGDLILDMNGGATPRKTDKEKFYSNKHHGIPLLRVQNITEQGISTTNVVYINHDTHNGYLQRSQVLENDLLVTITGRIASSAVAPKRFIGNINQHSVVIKTKNKETSQYIAAFLNSHVGQKLALKRTTGGTRPALDYVALKSIPIIKNLLIVAKMDAAYAVKKRNEAEAQQLLDGIDGYLLGELGIELPEQQENTLQSRMFTRRLSKVSGGRFDAPIHQKKYILETNKYPMSKFRDCVFINPFTSFFGLSSDTSTTFIPMEKVSGQYGEADISDCRILEKSEGYTKFQDNDLLWAKITPCMQNGKSAVVTKLKNGVGFGSTEFHIFREKSLADIRYIHGLLRLRSLRNHAILYLSGSAGHQRVSDEFFKNLSIPSPPLEKQAQIAAHITEIRTQAKQLQQQAKVGLEQAKKEVEIMILGEDESKV